MVEILLAAMHASVDGMDFKLREPNSRTFLKGFAETPV